MKDSQFLELLNLYLDHEISAVDAAKLEAEVQINAARRSIYQDYCRMQKACKLVVSDFQVDAEAEVAALEKKIVEFHPAAAAPREMRRVGGGIYTVGTFAALAACVAIVFVGRNRPDAKSEMAASPVIPAVAPSVETSLRIPSPETVTPRRLVSVASTSSSAAFENPLFLTLLTNNPQAEVMRASSVQQPGSQLAWIRTLQLPPLPQRGRLANDLHFDATLASDERALGGRANASLRQQEPAEESAAFRIIK